MIQQTVTPANDLSLYRRLSNLRFMNYRGKIMVTAFLGTHIPLIALATWFALQTSRNWQTFVTTVGVALGATLVGTGITLFVLDRLLRPVLMTSKALRVYRETRERLPLPDEYSDEVGTLMADAGRTLEHLDGALHGLELAIETKNRFIAAAAHDLRQPAIALSLYAEHLLEFPEMHLELAPKIAAASASVNEMFESLFDLANLDAGKVLLKPQPVDVGKLLCTVQTQFEPLALKKNIRLRVRESRVVIQTDAMRLQRMICNVVGNAIKYSPPDRRILLAVRPDGSGARIEIWDQGFGIPAQDLDRVFEEFFRVDRPSTPGIEGVGLGLSIVSRLARILNAKVELRSEVGRGTRFCFRIRDIDAQECSFAAVDAAG